MVVRLDEQNHHDLARVLVILYATWWARWTQSKTRSSKVHLPPWASLILGDCYYKVHNIWTHASRPRIAKWIPPYVGSMKLNVDPVMSCHADKGATAVVCRDGNGKFLGASTLIFLWSHRSINLGSHACTEALALAQDIHIFKLCIASNHLEVVTNIIKGSSSLYAAILPKKPYRPSSGAGSQREGFRRPTHPNGLAHGRGDGITGSSNSEWNDSGG